MWITVACWSASLAKAVNLCSVRDPASKYKIENYGEDAGHWHLVFTYAHTGEHTHIFK